MTDRTLDVPRTRESVEADEDQRLGPWALRSRDSVGRVHPESEHPYRTAFQRDRDRIVHSTAFRRLEYKTQVFVYLEGDHYRNRLTHTLEGAQITRTLARALRLNEDIAEAIALAHDLGHTPFGHVGERVLAAAMKGNGGFDHNRQSLRVVDLLEHRTPKFVGLNLTDETREGILKHGCHWDHPTRLPKLSRNRPLESQAADVADEIAYMNHDLDDALRSGLFDFAMLAELPLVGPAIESVRAEFGDLDAGLRRAQVVVRIIDTLVTDVLEASAVRLRSLQPAHPDEARASETRLVEFSDAVFAEKRVLKRFLFERFYHHPKVLRMTGLAERVLADLFDLLSREPERLPEHVRARFEREGAMRAVADHVAGMTDRFAMQEHRRLLGPEAAEEVREIAW